MNQHNCNHLQNPSQMPGNNHNESSNLDQINILNNIGMSNQNQANTLNFQYLMHFSEPADQLLSQHSLGFGESGQQGLKMCQQNSNKFQQVNKIGARKVKKAITKIQTIGDIIVDIQSEIKKQYGKKKQKKVKSELTQKDKQSWSSQQCDELSVKSQQSKCWNQQQQELFMQLVESYGTDFNMIKQFFPKKSKNQIKNKYKAILNNNRKMQKKSKIQKLKNVEINNKPVQQPKPLKQSSLQMINQKQQNVDMD